MDWLIGILTVGISEHLGSILTGIGAALLAVFAYFGGRRAERDKGTINTQKEIIDAHEDRQTAEDIVRRTPPTDSGSVRNKYQRD